MLKIVADSISWTNSRLTSVIMRIPTCLLAQLRTHRLLKWTQDEEMSSTISEFSINANSDRAIPIKTKLKMVKENPYIPMVSLANPGMTAIEDVPQGAKDYMTSLWKKSMEDTINIVDKMLEMGASKQYANRLLMPYSYSDVIVTGDQFAWQHFFNLRTSDSTEPHFRSIAKELQALYNNSTPVFKKVGEYHIAFEEEANNYEGIGLMDKLAVSGSCCARISYNIEREEELSKHRSRFALCVNSGHSSITEHQARVPSSLELHAMNNFRQTASNINGWLLLRKLIETKSLCITDGILEEKEVNVYG